MIIKHFTPWGFVLIGSILVWIFGHYSPVFLYPVSCSPSPCTAYREIGSDRYWVVTPTWKFYVWPQLYIVKVTYGTPFSLGIFAIADSRAPQVTMKPRSVKMSFDPKLVVGPSSLKLTIPAAQRITFGR